ncbi:MAG: SIR2 family protein [Syntrophales bacterium]|nr:SIR2 family protein [Syntrophales bacterium]
MKKKATKTILLTGAGFTKNFGGFLAKEMWSKIFNHRLVEEYQKLRKLLCDDYDYESIYHKVLSGEFSIQEKGAITNAILAAYVSLDDVVRNWTFRQGAPYPVNIYGVNNFIRRFAGKNGEFGFFFTMNQDLFIERHFNDIRTGLGQPAIRRLIDQYMINLRLPIEKINYISLPTKDMLQRDLNSYISGQTICYIKLHGSYGWQSSDGKERLVIGRDKEKQIQDEPLLSWYFELFKEALESKERKLFTIGYSFRDSHINKIIADSAINHGLKLYILSPEDPTKFMTNIKSVEYGEQIRSSINKYYPYNLLDVFPSNQDDSHAWKEIIESYFTE